MALYKASRLPNAALWAAINSGRVDEVRGLIQQGIPADFQDAKQKTPLHISARKGDAAMCAMLIEQGAHLETKDWVGRTPLFYSLMAPNKDLVGFLLQSGANVQAIDADGNTPLHLAASVNMTRVCEQMLELGADLEAVDDDGATPLHRASEGRHHATCLALLRRGADVERRGPNAMTALQLALEQAGTISERSHIKMSALQMALFTEIKQLCLVLVAWGADAKRLGTGNQEFKQIIALSALEAAVQYGDARTIDRLLGSDPAPGTLAGRLQLACHLAQGHGCEAGPAIARSWLAAHSARAAIEEMAGLAFLGSSGGHPAASNPSKS